MNEQIKVNFDKIEKILNLSKENISLRKKSFDQFKKIGFPNKKTGQILVCKIKRNFR